MMNPTESTEYEAGFMAGLFGRVCNPPSMANFTKRNDFHRGWSAGTAHRKWRAYRQHLRA